MHSHLHFQLGFQNLVVDFVIFSHAREAFFIRHWPVTDISQSTEYFGFCPQVRPFGFRYKYYILIIKRLLHVVFRNLTFELRPPSLRPVHICIFFCC